MRFLILAISYKHNGLCVAGLDYDTFKFVRLGRAIENDISCNPLNNNDIQWQGRVLRIRDLIDINVKKMSTHGCQTENYQLIEIKDYIRTLSGAEISDLHSKIQHSEFIFINNRKTLTFDEGKNLDYSIGFFRVSNLVIKLQEYESGKQKYKAFFRYNSQQYDDISMTDSTLCNYPRDLYKNDAIVNKEKPIKEIGDAHIMVTMAPTPWEVDNKFYKYVSGVIFVNLR